jgi:hypothetical protein
MLEIVAIIIALAVAGLAAIAVVHFRTREQVAELDRKVALDQHAVLTLKIDALSDRLNEHMEYGISRLTLIGQGLDELAQQVDQIPKKGKPGRKPSATGAKRGRPPKAKPAPPLLTEVEASQQVGAAAPTGSVDNPSTGYPPVAPPPQ